MFIIDLILFNLLLIPRILFCIFFSFGFLVFLIIWSVIGLILLIAVYRIVQKYKHLDIDAQHKYKDFIRSDWHNWNFFYLYIGFILFGWIKILGIVLTVFITWLMIKIHTYGVDDLEHLNDDKRQKVRGVANASGLMFSLSCGIIISKKEVEVSYEEYLGKGYNTSSDKADKKDHAVIISNHVSWLDVTILMRYIGCGFIASKAVKSFPFIGTVCTALGSIYVDRLSKEDRMNSLLAVESKLTDIYNNKVNSDLIIFPEGTTTNGQYLLPFKKGAFSKMYPCKPYIIKIDAVNHISLAMDIIEMIIHIFIIICCPFYKVEVDEFPVFSPNKFFEVNYIKTSNKEPWRVYADTMRKILLSKTELKEGILSYEDKRKFLDGLRNPESLASQVNESN